MFMKNVVHRLPFSIPSELSIAPPFRITCIWSQKSISHSCRSTIYWRNIEVAQKDATNPYVTELIDVLGVVVINKMDHRAHLLNMDSICDIVIVRRI